MVNRTRPCVALLSVTTALLAACSSPPAATWLPARSPAPTTSPTTEITLAFAGDVHFAGRTLPLLADPATAFGPIARTLSAADLAMVNLETAVTRRGTPAPKQFHFRAPPSAVAAVRAAGVDVVSLANNHVLDYGQVGLADTLHAARIAGLPAVGGGLTASEAYAPWTVAVGGARLAFLGFSQVHELWQAWQATSTRPGIAAAQDREQAAAAVRAADLIADVVIVYVHWGREGWAYPLPEMRQFARLLARAGADIVLGTHAHLLLGEEWIGSTYVQYGLGNFLWWRDDAYSNDTGVLLVTLREGQVTRARLLPAVISRETGQPVPASGPDSRRITSDYAALTRAADRADAPPPELARAPTVG